ncbi:MAG: uroporphyrinogen-III C-methyltransferase [Acidobacteria bacterium]|nr:MAG: uroporphyrinogen-III C-methyltransferase [Acidobacteriota bacterium]
MADLCERASRISSGTVSLVGAGPGDPGLLTVRALELIRNANVVLHDHLVTREILAECKPGARRIDIGKVGHGPQANQTAIEQLLISLARAGRCVVRLKGGDPLLFGRGAEEAMALRRADVPFEIVPGVSSALAAPAYAGISLTARGIASTVAIMSGHCASTGAAPTSVPSADTIVVLMGVANAVAVRDRLIASGRRGDTAAAVIEWGTCAQQRVAVGTLATLPEVLARGGLHAPAVIVIGDVVGRRAMMDWRSDSGDTILSRSRLNAVQQPGAKT